MFRRNWISEISEILNLWPEPFREPCGKRQQLSAGLSLYRFRVVSMPFLFHFCSVSVPLVRQILFQQANLIIDKQ